jgi:hypothetical protein
VGRSLVPRPDKDWLSRGLAEERFALVAGLRRLRVFELVAGEETRSGKARKDAEVAARHLVPFGAALWADDPARAECSADGEFHGISAFGAEYTLRSQR